MKKIIYLILALSLTACSNSTLKKQENSVAETSTQESEIYKKGVNLENHYESEWLNLKLDTPEGYVLSTDEELGSLLGEVSNSDMIKDEVKEKLNYENIETVYEMAATNYTNGTNIIVITTKLPFSSMDLDMIAKSVKESFSIVLNDSESIKIIEDTTDAEIAGLPYKKFVLENTQDSIGSLIQEMYIGKKGNRSINITVTYLKGYEEEGKKIFESLMPLK